MAEEAVPGGGPPRGGGRRRSALVTLVVLALGVVPFLSNLDLGFYRDDYLHVFELEGGTPLPKTGPLSLFAFAEARPDRMPVQGDYWPWWKSPDTSIAFFRPLASAAYVVGHAIHGMDARAYLAGNLVLWGVVLVVVLRLFRELARESGRGLGAVFVAGALFAIDRAHEENVAWLGGRYTLVGLVFCVPALLAYHRWRSGGGRLHAGMTLLWLALAMASSEMPVALAGWFFAYELSLAKDSFASRVRALALPAAAIGAYVLFYATAGYGVVGSSWYLDPFREPAAFVNDGLAVRWPRLLRTLFSSEWIDLELRGMRQRGEVTPATALLVPYAVAAALLLVLVVRSVRDRTTRFVLLGAIVGLVPIATSPSPPRQRVLFLASVGSAWALGVIVSDAVRAVRARAAGEAGPGVVRVAIGLVLAVVVLAVHAAFEPQLTAQALEARRISAEAERRVSLEAEFPSDAEAPDARVLLLTSPLDGVAATFLPMIRAEAGHAWPGAAWAISVCPQPHLLTRTGERTFELEIVGAPKVGLLQPGWVGVVREDVTPDAGHEWRAGELRVTAQAVEAERLRRVECEIDRDLDDGSVWLLAWFANEGRWKRVPAPAIGEALPLPPTLGSGPLPR